MMSTIRLIRGRYGAAAVGWQDRVYVFGGSGKEGLIADVEAINARTGNVAPLPWKLMPRRYHKAAILGDTAFLVGGYGSGGNTLDLERIDLRTGVVTKCRPAPTQHTSATVVVANGLLWVIGGSVNGGHTGAMDIYNSQSDTWEGGPPLPTPRECTGVVHNGLIHVVGGFAGKAGMRTWETYSIGQGRWVPRPELPFPISAHHMAIVENTAYAFGDYAVLSRVIACDLRGGKWSAPRLPEPFVPRRHVAVTALGDTVYAIGGNIAGSGSFLDTVQAFRVPG
ncbi:MAG: hypothetical protein H8F28_05125 [Fibrella sp.]|nr:hypothetical protein [Armatimonadota bacterium]